MKKNLLLLAVILAGTFTAANAYPGVDVTVGGSATQVLQQNAFQKMEMDDYKRFKDAHDRPAERSMETPLQMKQDFERKYEYQTKPAKIKLNSYQTEDGEQIHLDTSNMEFVQKDGKVILKYGE